LLRQWRGAPLWKHSGVSKAAMPLEFEQIIVHLRKVEAYDLQVGWADKFELKIE
jgi:hypothetical protein